MSAAEIVAELKLIRTQLAATHSLIEGVVDAVIQKRAKREKKPLPIHVAAAPVDFIADPDAKSWIKVHLKGNPTPFSTQTAEHAAVAIEAHRQGKPVAIEYTETIRRGWVSRYIQTIQMVTPAKTKGAK